MTGAEQRAAVRDQAREVARGWSGPEAPAGWALTAALFEHLAADDSLAAQAAEIPPDRIPALVFVASVQYLVARNPGEPLAAYFPPPLGSGRPVDAHLASSLRSFCAEHHDELAVLGRTRRYQMNEVARCTQVALALGVLGEQAPGRAVALIDVGTGSGLGLFPDRYRYQLSDGRCFGAADSSVTVPCHLHGHLGHLPALPTIGARTGIDINPIDLGDADARAWLAACLPPVAGAADRLQAAVDVVVSSVATILGGDGVAALPDVLATVPDDLLVVVTDTYAAVFFDEGALAHLADVIADYGRQRDVAWISLDPLVPLGLDASGSVQGLAVPADLVALNRRGGVFALLSMVTHLGGVTASCQLATAHPSGTVMTWLDR